MISTNSFHRTLEHKAAGGALDLAPSGGGFGSWQEQAQYKEGYSQFQGWLYSAIHALASQGASQPVIVAKLEGKRKEKKESERKRGIANKAYLSARMTKGARAKAVDSDYEILEDHAVKDLLERPNSFQNRWQFAYSFISNLCLTGWSFVVADVNKGKVELYCLPTTWVKPVHDPSPFSSFEVKNPKKHAAESALLKREQVAFAYLPNPSDPLSAYAPADSQKRAVRIDDHIQTSQEAFFSNGIFPSVIITVGKQPFSDTQGRPVLSGAQRRQLFSAISREHMRAQNYGKPMIIDGMVEKIDRHSATQNEMGWQKSEDKIRTRMLSALGVAPYVMGEAVPGSYAQSFNTKEIFYDRVNTYLDMLGSMLSNFLAGLFGDEGLLIWWEEKQARDPSLYYNTLVKMRSSGDLSRNEIRAEMGFAPVEELEEEVRRSALLESVGGMTGTISVLAAVGQGTINPDAAANMLALFLQIPLNKAEEMVMQAPKKEMLTLESPATEVPPLEEEQTAEAVEELKKSMDLLRMSMSSVHVADVILEEVGCSH